MYILIQYILNVIMGDKYAIPHVIEVNRLSQHQIHFIKIREEGQENETRKIESAIGPPPPPPKQGNLESTTGIADNK